VSEPAGANRPNEDGWGVAGPFAWIIDGATGLGDTRLLDAPSDAAWLTAVLDAALREGAAAAGDPGFLLAEAAATAEARFEAERHRAPAERYEIPTAAVLLARFGDDGVTVVDLGDCGLYLAGDGRVRRIGGTESGRAAEQTSARRLMGSGSGRGPDVLSFLREVRNKANRPDGYAIFAPDAGCAYRARRNFLPLQEGLALFLTDGFEAAVEDYGLHSAQSLVASADRLGEVVAAIRAAERDDPDCVRYPRFKPSDDATALSVRFGPARTR